MHKTTCINFVGSLRCKRICCVWWLMTWNKDCDQCGWYSFLCVCALILLMTPRLEELIRWQWWTEAIHVLRILRTLTTFSKHLVLKTTWISEVGGFSPQNFTFNLIWHSQYHRNGSILRLTHQNPIKIFHFIFFAWKYHRNIDFPLQLGAHTLHYN